jgi:uncharacterized protein (DUF1684 family)
MSAVEISQPGQAGFEQYLKAWNEARQTREQQRRDPNSYISYSSFQKLIVEPQRFDAIPGVWRLTPAGSEVVLAGGESLDIDGQLVTGMRTFAPVKERELRRVAKDGDVILELSRRGGQHLLRTLDPAFGERLIAEYDHTPTYEPDFKWIVEGEFIPIEHLRQTDLPATIGDIIHVHPAVGEVVFQLGGAEQRLLVLGRDTANARQPGTAFTIFTDATSGNTTDPHGRSIEVEHRGTRRPVTVDFNLARNIQRPYTRFAPCPLTPPGNHLDVAVEAGEQLPIFKR